MPRWLKIVVACVLLAALAAGIDWSSAPQSPRPHRLAHGCAGAPRHRRGTAWSTHRSGRGRCACTTCASPGSYLFRTGCFAYFFNNFLPSAIGGDVYRIYRTLPPDGDRSRAVSAVLVERVVGLGGDAVQRADRRGAAVRNERAGARAMCCSPPSARRPLVVVGAMLYLGVVRSSRQPARAGSSGSIRCAPTCSASLGSTRRGCRCS